MNLYLIEKTDQFDFDSYESAVVAAPGPDEARRTDPGSGSQLITENDWNRVASSWCNNISYVTADYLGVATEGVEQGVILAKFNPG